MRELAEDSLLWPLPALTNRVPAAGTGLDVWEHRLLTRLAHHKEVTAATIGHTFGDPLLEDPDQIGDWTLFERLLELSAPDYPGALLHRFGPGTRMADTSFTLTETGHAVLRGEANRLDLLPYDRWIGGTHLDSRSGHVWVREADGSLRAR